MLWLCGASGVGKSSVGWEIFCQVRATGVRAAYLDFDQIGFFLPAPADDPDNHRLKAANLGVLWPNLSAAGAGCLVASGLVDTSDAIRAYVDAVPGLTPTVCRLRAGPAELQERILRRGWGGGPPIPGDELSGASAERLAQVIAESVQNAHDLERDRIGDLCVDTDGRSIPEVAELVRTKARWPQRAQ